MLITKDMGIMEIVQKYPATVEVLQRFGMGCIGCAAALDHLVPHDDFDADTGEAPHKNLFRLQMIISGKLLDQSAAGRVGIAP